MKTSVRAVQYVSSGSWYAHEPTSRPDSEAHMYTVEPAIRRAAFHLGLGDLNAKRPCHGYACGCTCGECRAQAKLINEHRNAGRNPFTKDGLIRKPPSKPQPWQTRKSA